MSSQRQLLLLVSIDPIDVLLFVNFKSFLLLIRYTLTDPSSSFFHRHRQHMPIHSLSPSASIVANCFFLQPTLLRSSSPNRSSIGIHLRRIDPSASIRLSITVPSSIDRHRFFHRHTADPSCDPTHGSMALCHLVPLLLRSTLLSILLRHCHSFPGIISNKCWIKRSICLVKQISLLEIISTAAVLLAMVVESSRVFHVVG